MGQLRSVTKSMWILLELVLEQKLDGIHGNTVGATRIRALILPSHTSHLLTFSHTLI
jgi:hypothetical protein